MQFSKPTLPPEVFRVFGIGFGRIQYRDWLFGAWSYIQGITYGTPMGVWLKRAVFRFNSSVGELLEACS